MLFVGLFVATPSTWKRRLTASAVIAVVIYVLNLLRNTGIVWFYGQGQASFWMMHDAIGKGGSLAAFVVLAFAAFAWYPEFLKALIGVLDLPYRDGPMERALKLGKRRPEPPTSALEAPAAAPAPASSP
jgi:exosortase/archaeosortase family protein